MEYAEKVLWERLYDGYKLGRIIIGVAIAVYAIILLVFIFRLIFQFRKINWKFVLVVCAFFLLTSLAGLQLGKITAAEGKDIALMETTGPIVVTGELVGFAHSASTGDDVSISRYGPIIQTAEGELLELNIQHSDQRMKIGETYTLIYLPNTKYAEIVE